ncbi:hypothetical protein NE237_012241 [Protea cynaroides]|uniref:Uncharacterized protein n=1 Tax=Protea cynaroides TaxID=273540 RepID=A0A9Q0JZ18_9MAGN|nr:hypothetical protein NE237_012241 [Protea cynaroides]
MATIQWGRRPSSRISNLMEETIWIPLYLASIIIGFTFGAQLTLLFAILSELFGLKYYSTLFNCGQLASPLGSCVLNVRIAGKLYDKEALKQLAKKGLDRSSVKELSCIGR